MSRCFPFPPPGYERKLGDVDDDNLLVKEKDKEKKHKRDKNKEKKEGKERDKDKSKDNRHNEKDKDKEKKEKHKHKNKDKKKDKSQCRDERAGSSNAERVGSNSPRNHFTGSSSAPDLSQTISYVGIATRIQTAVKISDRDHGSGELLEKPRFDQMANGQRGNGETRLPNVAIVCDSDGVDNKRAEICRSMEIDRPVEEKQNQMRQRIEKGVQNKEKNGKRFDGQGIQINPPKDTAFVQELGRRISTENGAGGRQVLARPNATNQKRIDSNGAFSDCDKAMSNHSSISKEISNFGNSINKKDGGGPKVLVRPVDMSKKLATGGLERRGPEMARPMDMDKRASVGGMERNGFSGGVGAMGHKEKTVITNDGVRNKAKTEKAEQGGGNIVNLSRLRKSGSDATDLSDYSNQHVLPVSNKSLQGVAAAAKRKEPEANGFLHDNGVRPIKLPRRVTSPQSDTKAGTYLQHSASNQGAPTRDSLMLGNKELKVVEDVVRAQQSPPFLAKPSTESPLGSSKSRSSVVDDANGTISAHGSPLGSTKPMSTKSKSKSKSKSKDKDKERERSLKSPSPHPDTKYLSQIYSIPKIDDCSESNDDEWLSGSKSSRSKETNMDSLTNDDGQPQVWAKAVNIESLDIYALPYVISC